MKQTTDLVTGMPAHLPQTRKKSFRFVLFLLLGIFLAVPIGLRAQDAKISINANNTTVRDVLKMIESKTDYHFAYNNKFIDVSRKVVINAEEDKVTVRLKKIFDGTDVT